MLTRRSFVGGAVGLSLISDPARAQTPGASATPDAIGCGAAIVTPNGIGGIVLAGRTRAGGGRALLPADRWHIGSNTKAMTAALYARLVEAGRCRWGATLPALFPDLSVHAGWRDVTVEQVMSHAAGLSDAAIDQTWLLRRHADASDVRAQRAEFARALLTSAPAAPPGRFSYGNAGYMLLGAAIERATDASWEEAIARELWSPLGMRSAGFGAPTGDALWGHAPGPVPVDPSGIADNPAALGPAGRVHLALGDYARFLSIYMTGGEGILSAATLKRLLAPSAGSAYAGGWSIQSAGDNRALAHEGSNTLWHAIAYLLPTRGIGYVAVANEGGARGRSAALAMLERVRGTRS